MSGILATGSIDSRLTVDGQVSELIHLGKLLVDDRGLFRRWLTGPGKCSQFVSTELGKQSGDVRKSMDIAKSSFSDMTRNNDSGIDSLLGFAPQLQRVITL